MSAHLLPAVRDLYSRLPETYLLEPWELQHVLYSLGYIDDLADEAEIAAAVEAGERERAERLEKSERAVFRVPLSPNATDAEEAQIHAAFRAAYNEVYSSTLSPESPEQAREELERILGQAERTGDNHLARAAFHRAADLGIQSVVDAYLDTRPQENRAWESYTAAYQEVHESRGIEHVLARGLAGRAFSSEAAG